jgi:2-methylisocitrate lyase-like PEP mutase family enzyme
MTPVRAAAARAERLRMLHAAPELLVLVNVWDAASARVVAAQPGCQALATASHAIAEAHGHRDGEQIPVDLMLAACRRIAAAAPELPVTADLEAGYGDVRATITGALEAGIVGCNLEDRCEPIDTAAARVEEAVAAGRDFGVPLVVNARTDVFLAAERHADVMDDAIARGRAFLEAGADVVFAVGVSDRELIRTLVEELGAVSVFASPRSPPLDVLESLGVQRASTGPGPMGIALAQLGREAASLLAHGPYPADLVFRPPPPPAT